MAFIMLKHYFILIGITKLLNDENAQELFLEVYFSRFEMYIPGSTTLRNLETDRVMLM